MSSELELGLLEKCKISSNILNSEGNKIKWNNGGKRGGFDYKPPKGWIGIGLNVLNLYENNDWIAHNGNKNEWAVAYINVSDKFLGFILKDGFQIGAINVYENNDDIYHPGNKVGKGVGVSPNIEATELYCFDSIEIKGKRYKFALMLRVKPDKIRCPSSQKDYWFLNPHEIRPYRILLKEIK